MDKNQGVKIDLELFVPGHPFTEKVSALNFEFVILMITISSSMIPCQLT